MLWLFKLGLKHLVTKTVFFWNRYRDQCTDTFERYPALILSSFCLSRQVGLHHIRKVTSDWGRSVLSAVFYIILHKSRSGFGCLSHLACLCFREKADDWRDARMPNADQLRHHSGSENIKMKANRTVVLLCEGGDNMWFGHDFKRWSTIKCKNLSRDRYCM